MLTQRALKFLAPHPSMDSIIPKNASFRRWLLLSLLLVAVWALGLTISQHFSIPTEENFRTKDLFGRFFLSFFLLSPFVLLLPRAAILGMLVLSLFFQWGTLYYCSYFCSAPEIMMLWNNGSEGAAVGDALWMMLPWKYVLFLGPFLVLQIVLLYRRTTPKSYYVRRLALSLCFIACYGALFWRFNDSWRGLRLNNATARMSNGDRCAKFGFLPVFVRDLAIRHTLVDKLRAQALENEKNRSFGLEKEYGNFPFENIVVLQVESLDNAVLDHCVSEKPVVPFLNSLQKNSLTYRIRANHRYGSATADFEMLNGVPPLDGFFNYQIPGLSYGTSLPRFFREQGYETFCFHGVPGSFFNRRAAFTAMEFDRLVFRDEIVDAVRAGKYPLRKNRFGENLEKYLGENWLRDEVLLKAVLHEIRSPSQGRKFFFVITETSHAPFDNKYFEPDDKLIPNETSQQEKYLNSIHAVDGWLRSFYEELPRGTLLVIYGDHTAGFRSGEFVSDIEGRKEFVPCFIHVVGENLAARQQVPRRPKETTLSVRDVHSFLRDAVERNADTAKTAPEKDIREARKEKPHAF